ncbi:MAG TPA: hypothetical protein VK638_52475 [Edaphobacter sp.]|nr:hypothetical protein [Edaphobacter sp.]
MDEKSSWVHLLISILGGSHPSRISAYTPTLDARLAWKVNNFRPSSDPLGTGHQA